MRTKKKRSPVILILDVVIGVLCVITVSVGAFAVASFREDWSFRFDADSFYYRLQDESYGTLVGMYYMNEAAGVEADEDMLQYYGVAKYFEAASYYKAYENVEDTKEMKKYQTKMKEAKSQMGELQFVSEKVDEELGIQ